MATEYSLASRVQIKFSSKWTDTLTSFEVTEDAQISPSVSLASGTGSGQANGQWQHSETIAAGATYTMNLTDLESEVFGGIGPISFSSIKFIYVRNDGPESVSVGAWSPWVGTSGMVVIPSGQFVLATNTGDGWSTASDQTMQIVNASSSAAVVKIFFAGVIA